MEPDTRPDDCCCWITRDGPQEENEITLVASQKTQKGSNWRRKNANIVVFFGRESNTIQRKPLSSRSSRVVQPEKQQHSIIEKSWPVRVTLSLSAVIDEGATIKIKGKYREREWVICTAMQFMYTGWNSSIVSPQLSCAAIESYRANPSEITAV